MPHRPLFVSQCHHFSPVIYFIAISVSLPLPPPTSLHCLLFFFTCTLPLHQPPYLHFLSHPRPRHVHEHLLARNSPPNHTTQFRSPHPLPEALLYISISVSFSLFLFLSRESSNCRFVSSFARVAPHQRYFDECRRERKGEEIERESKERRRRQERGKKRESGEETTLSRARLARRRERYNCI